MRARIENLAPPPRSVPLSLRAAVMNSFRFKAGTVIFAAGMILFWYLALPLSWREARFWFAGPLMPARATVISAEFTRWTKAHGSSGSRFTGGVAVLRFRYRFTDARGTVREGVSYIEGGDVPAPGKQIGIEFAPNRPWNRDWRRSQGADPL